MRQQDKIIIWPAYFDSTRTRIGGRRVPKNLAVPTPKILEIKDAVEKLRVDHELVADVAYPKTPWIKTGMILVKKKQAKDNVIRTIAAQLLQMRTAEIERKGAV